MSMHWLHLSRRFATWAVVILAAGLVPSVPPASAASYSVPAIAKVTATIPLPPDLQNVCLVRSETSGSQIDQRFMCYATAAPADPPPPPPPPYQAAIHQVVVSDFSPTTGLLTVPVLPCVEFLPGYLALKVDLLIPLVKGGGQVGPGNYVMLREDTDAPCTNGTVRFGPLTLEPLAQSHDEDGEPPYDHPVWVGCTRVPLQGFVEYQGHADYLYAEVQLDTNHWFNSAANRHTVNHELGHVLGLDDPDPESECAGDLSIMHDAFYCGDGYDDLEYPSKGDLWVVGAIMNEK